MQIRSRHFSPTIHDNVRNADLTLKNDFLKKSPMLCLRIVVVKQWVVAVYSNLSQLQRSAFNWQDSNFVSCFLIDCHCCHVDVFHCHSAVCGISEPI